MEKQLVMAGNTWQLYINKPIANLMGINNKEYTVLLKIDNKSLIVQKIKNKDASLLEGNVLTKRLIKRTSGYGLNLSQPIIKLLGINPETDMLSISIDKDILTIAKHK